MKIIYKTILVFFFTFLLPAVFAQKNGRPVHFANGDFITGNNIEQQTFKKESIGAAFFNDTYFVLVQFSQLPSKTTWEKLKAAGLTLNGYLPEYTYLAAIKNSFDFTAAKNYHIISINALPSFYKVNKKIYSYTTPAKKEEEQGIAVNYAEQVDKRMVVALLQQRGAAVITEKFGTGNLILIRYNKTIIDSIAALPFVTALDMQAVKDQLLNYEGSSAHSVSSLNAWAGKNLNGKGVTIGVGDNADISTHIDFSGRLINRNPNTPSYHGTHVTGTAAGGGLINPRHKGMAPKSTIVSQSFSDVIVYAPSYVADYNMIATNNSYHSAPAGCQGEREYNSLSRYGDEQMRSYSALQHVFASGNDGNSTCSPYPTSFGTIKSGWQCGKNILTVGALNVANNSIASYSGRGPTADGRIKPEITADGFAVYSTVPFNNYDINYGTSMAAPGVTGALALLYERYRQTHTGNDPASALIKAITCNTAEDLGNAGPDYTYGFGMLNARRAVEAIDSNRYFSGTIANGANATHSFTVPANTRRIKVMLYWNDAAAASNATTTLVNDIDMVLIEPSLALHRPLILNTTPASVNNVAAEAPDHLNNIEQAVIENPAPGVYSAALNGYNIPSGNQDYVVTYEILKNGVTVEYPNGGETFVPGETETIRWSAYGSEANTFTIEYSINNGGSWLVIDNNVTATARLYNWVVPAVASSNTLIRITRNSTSLTGQSNVGFTILGQPTVTATVACEGAVQLSWPAITIATTYDVYQLIGDSMQVIGNTNSTNYLITGLNKNQVYWFATAAKINSISGRRSVAPAIIPNSGACSLSAFNNDLKVDTILEPNTARQLFSNAANATRPVKLSIKNVTNSVVTGPFSVSFDYGGTVVTEVINVTINPANTITYVFAGTYPVPAAGYDYNFKAWVTKTDDANHANDTAYKRVKYINNDAIASLPLTENFETTDSNVEFKNGEMSIGGNKYLDFGSSSARGRARTFVNSGFSLNGSNSLTLDQSPYSSTANADSAVFNYNLSLFTSKQIRFDFYYKNHGQADAAGNKIWIRGSENNNWVQAFDLFANQADLGEWRKSVININEILTTAIPAQTVSSTFQIKIGQEGYNSANSPEPIIDADDGYTFDNLVLNEALNDVGMLSVNFPGKDGCGLSAANPIGIKLRNYNNVSLNNVQVSYRINNGSVVTETITNIAANQTLDYTFTQTANLSAYIDYDLDVWVKYATDNYASNDSVLNYSFHGSPVITTYPYLQDFENDNGNFFSNGTNNTWQWGNPEKNIINKAASGSKAWTTNLSGNYSDYETSYLISPCFDLTGLTNPALSFSHIYEVEEDYDYTWVEYSTDGKIWNKLGNINNGTNWYDDPATNSWNFSTSHWHVASIDIPVTNTVVRFRFVMSSDAGVTEEGIGIDDVRIFERSVIADAISTASIGSAIVSGNNWIRFNLGDSIIAEINANGQNLGTVTVQPYLNTGAVRNSNNQYYNNRNYVIRSTNPAGGDVTVRLYFTDAEAEDLINATGCNTCAKPADAYETSVTRYWEFYTEDNGTIDDNLYNSYKFIQPVKIIPHYNGYYAEFTIDNFCEFWFGKGNIAPTSVYACQGSNTASFASSVTGTTYQWQVNTGSGYNNISNGPNYAGATTATLQANNLLTSFTGYKYRCVVDGVNGTEYTLRFKNTWTGAVSADWFTTGNWTCSVVPDQYTDVVIPTGAVRYPTLTANTVIRSIRMLKNAPVNINAGVRLDLNGR
jgi:hypothetical protein